MPKSLTPIQIATASSENQQATLGIIIAESFGMGAMFIMMLKASWRKFLEAHLRKFLFPLAVLCDITCAALVWHMVYLKPRDKNLLTRAIIETIGVLVEVAAILMVIFAAAVAGVVTPLLLTVATGAKAVVNTALGIFYAVKASFMSDPEQKNKHTMLALECGVQALCGALITIATAGALLAGKIGFALFGIAAAIIGLTVCTYKWATLLKPQSTTPEPPTDSVANDENLNDLSENAKIAKSLGLQQQQASEKRSKASNDIEMQQKRPTTMGSSNLKFFPDFDLIEFSETQNDHERTPAPEVIYVNRLRGG